jgi:polysaccharide deacetylase 2 family uncharacterized protein YibQ
LAKKQSKHFLNGLLVFLIILSVAAIVYVLLVQEEKISIKEPKKEPAQIEQKKLTVPKVEGAKPAEEKTSKTIPRAKKDKEKIVVSKIEKMPLPLKQIAIIIDDIGYDLEIAKELLNINADITFSVLPFLNHSREAAEMIHQAKREILLHLPMEPVSYPREKPGAGALFTDMNNNELLFQLDKNIDSVPYVSGVNNHMGSKFMEDREKLVVVFGQLKKRNLFFIDSRTAPDSEAIAAAQKVGLRVAERKIFIDNKRDYKEIYNNLIGVINHNGDASQLILIGHPYPETIKALRDAVKVLRTKGILVVPVSRIIKAKDSFGVS